MSGYIGTQPVPQATQHRETFTATASQTTFATVGYTPQFVDVYLNGIHLLDTVDYTATNSSDVVLTTGAAASDVVEIISYTPFEVANQTFTGTTTVDVLTATGATTVGGTLGVTGLINGRDVALDLVHVTSQTLAAGQNWAGIAYADPDAIGANPTALIYPDGTIYGSTDNGKYTKFADGTLIITQGVQLAGGVTTYDWTYPMLFSGTVNRRLAKRAIDHAVSISRVYGDAGTGASIVLGNYLTGEGWDPDQTNSTGRATLHFTYSATVAATRYVDFNFTAKGRWK